MVRLYEDVLLLLHADTGEHHVIGADGGSWALMCAALVELVQSGQLVQTRDHTVFKDALVQPHPAHPGGVALTGDAVLDLALATVVKVDGKLTKTLRETPQHWRRDLSDDLVRRGLMVRHEHRTLGLIDSPRFQVVDLPRVVALRRSLTDLLAGTAPLHARPVALLAVLYATGLTAVVTGGKSRRATKRAVVNLLSELQKQHPGDPVLRLCQATHTSIRSLESPSTS